MRNRDLGQKLIEVLTSSLDIHGITNRPDRMVKQISKLLLDKNYKGPIIIVHGDEGLYMSGHPDNREKEYMLFFDRTQLKK